jgi:hypothetical protein
MTKPKLTDEVMRRLLVAKGLLGRIRFSYTAQPDRITLASHILTAHDSAELAVAAISHYLGQIPEKSKAFLMNYFPLIQQSKHPDRQVEGRDYFSQLNDVRVGIKHRGIFPDPRDWKRVADRTWDYMSVWCQEYLGLSLEDLDESNLISDDAVKTYYDAASEALKAGKYQQCFEQLSLACQNLFEGNRALRNLTVGTARAEDAIKLAAYGVHANDYLALQQFLPEVSEVEAGPLIRWQQEQFGHPGNWTKYNAEFAMRAFIDLALRIQDAEWIPGPFHFHSLYNYKVTATEDGVEVRREASSGLIGRTTEVVHVLKKGESIRYRVIERASPISFRLRDINFNLNTMFFVDENMVRYEIDGTKISISCVPKDDPLIQEHFPHLEEIPYEP